VVEDELMSYNMFWFTLGVRCVLKNRADGASNDFPFH